VGSVLGFIGTAGSASGALFSLLVGYLLAHYSYGLAFMLAGSMHVIAALLLWRLMRTETNHILPDADLVVSSARSTLG